MDLIYFDETKESFCVSGERPSFIPSNLPYQPGGIDEPHTCICHSISFYTIAQGIVNALNCSFINKAAAINYIFGMIVSVLTIPVPNDWVTFFSDGGFQFAPNSDMTTYQNFLSNIPEDYQQSVSKEEANFLFQYTFNLEPYVALMKKIEDAMNIDCNCQCKYYYIAANASEIVRLLNSEKVNLRTGFSNWNSSTQSAYDPIRYIYDNGFLITSLCDSIRISNLIHFTLGKDENILNTEDALFFYSARDNQNTPFLYSSNNPISFEGTADYSECKDPIYYYDYIRGGIYSIFQNPNETQS